MLATRTKKARHEARCFLCQKFVHVGQAIGFVQRIGWVHTQCIVDHNRKYGCDQHD